MGFFQEEVRAFRSVFLGKAEGPPPPPGRIGPSLRPFRPCAHPPPNPSASNKKASSTTPHPLAHKYAPRF